MIYCLAASGATLTRGETPPAIEHTFPVTDETRAPDRTLPKVSAGSVATLAYSTDGRALATAGSDPVIRLWDARTGEQGTGELLRALSGHRAPVRSIAFRGLDGMVSLSGDGTVTTWDLSNGRALRSTRLKVAARTAILRPGAEPFLADSEGGQARLWNHESGERIRTYGPRGAGPSRLAFSTDGKALVTATAAGVIALWSVETGERLFTADAGVAVLALAASTTHVVAGFADGAVKVWPIGDGGMPRVLNGLSAELRAVALSPKGDQLAAAGKDRAVKVWDVETGQLLCSQEAHMDDVVSVVFNPNGQKMASGDAGGRVNYWTVPLPPLPPGDLAKIDAALPAKAALPKKQRKVLVFWRADAILHKGGTAAANHAIERMGKATGAFEADFTRDYAALNPKTLAGYDAIVMNNTAHLAIPDGAKQAYLQFARGGGGVVGIHAAIDTFRNWPEGAAVVGATFGNHPWHPSGTWAVKLEEPDHPLLGAWGGKGFKIHDELYEMGDPYTRADRRVLMTVDLSDPTTAGVPGLRRPDRDFALSWIKSYGKGRVFYCAFGHIVEPFQDKAVLQHYLDGIQYALGDLDLAASAAEPSSH